MVQDPNVRAQAGQLQQSTRELEAMLGREQDAASRHAETRKSQLEGLSLGTKEYLTGKRNSILEAVEKEIAAKKEAQSSLQKEFEALMAGGDHAKLPAKFLEQIGANDFMRRRGEAETKWSEIMAKYPQLKDVPVLSKPVMGVAGMEGPLPPGIDQLVDKRDVLNP